MLNLKSLQSQFQQYLMEGFADPILPSIAPDTHFSANNRLKVYHDAYYLRLLDVLQLDFPKTHMLLGDEVFEKAFFTYIQKHPSGHFSVRYFGQHFSSFLATTSPFQEHPILAEMAQFEWSVSYTLDAPNGSVVTKEDFAALSPEAWADLRVTFHPSLISHCFAWDTPQIWQQIDQEGPPRSPIQQIKPVRWLFWRKGIRTFFQSCTSLEDLLFQALQKSASFSEVCESLLTDEISDEEIPFLIAQTLHKWVSEEMLSRIYS